MIRKRNEIDFDIKTRKANLETAINDSVKDEKKNDEHITSITKKLSELTSEICFEDTLEGSIKVFENTAFEKIRDILRELSRTTGKSYNFSPTSPFWYFNNLAFVGFDDILNKGDGSSL